MHRFYVASNEEVQRGETTNIYFARTGENPEGKGVGASEGGCRCHYPKASDELALRNTLWSRDQKLCFEVT